MGGLQVQFNIIDRKTLEEARKHPKNYQDLFVRVSGYSAYFKDLNPHMQEEIITRAEYNLDTGNEVHY
jgi:formate C-acetyltransferase